jgi:hypothetical protein
VETDLVLTLKETHFIYARMWACVRVSGMGLRYKTSEFLLPSPFDDQCEVCSSLVCSRFAPGKPALVMSSSRYIVVQLLEKSVLAHSTESMVAGF